jgi:hypothetical protein
VAKESDRPTTGDPAVDQIIREKMSEACDLTFAILQDRHREFTDANTEEIGRTVAIIVSQIWHPFSEILVAMTTLAAKDMA